MNRVFVIAEAGVNHNGNIDTAKKMVDVAVEAGADAVKFQTFKAERLAKKDAPKASYQLETTESTESQFVMLKKLELTETMHEELIRYCKEKQIMFLSAPFDVESLYYLVYLGLDIIKIPSGEITNYPLLREAGKTGRDVILSTGMSNLEEVHSAVKVLQQFGAGKITLLHCNTEYPTPFEDVNLRAMLTLKQSTGLSIGYSDHTTGIEVPIAATALGAEVIEKHFTLDRNMEGPDHKASLEPDELKMMVQAIRNIEAALGNSKKEIAVSEMKNRVIARKSIVAKENIAMGEKFTEKNLTVKRPGNGISPMNWNEILGLSAKKCFQKDDQIEI